MIRNTAIGLVKEWNRHIEKEKLKKMKKLTQSKFLEKCILVHDDRFIYDKSIYINTRTKIIITCKIHGDFLMSPDSHIIKKQGCSKCALESHKLSEISIERLENMKFIHNNKYLYEDLSVDNGKINIICKTHGNFSQIIHNHENGNGCYKCEKESRVKIRLRECRTCNIKKEFSSFDKNRIVCKECDNIILSSKICIKCNIHKNINDFPIRIIKHRNVCTTCYDLQKLIISKNYRQKNKKSIRAKDLVYRKNRMLIDPLYRAKMDARNIIRKSLSKSGYTKKSKTNEILGCSYLDFKNHIESLFLDGMSWNNRNEWHIDHIIPLSFAESESECLVINNYTNLRPLWVEDNLIKSDYILEKTYIYYKILSDRKLINTI